MTPVIIYTPDNCSVSLKRRVFARSFSDYPALYHGESSSSSLLLSSLELSDTKVYEPYIRALFGNASHFWGVPYIRGGEHLISEGVAAIPAQHFLSQNP